MSAKQRRREDPAAAAVREGWLAVRRHPLFAPLVALGEPERSGDGGVPRDGWGVVDSRGRIRIHAGRRATAAEWTWVFAHLLLHLGLGHLDPARTGGQRLDAPHVAACDVAVNRFLATLRLGRSPLALPPEWPREDEATLARAWRRGAIPETLTGCGVAGSVPDVVLVDPPPRWQIPPDWEALFAAGLTAAVAAAVDVAGGARANLGDARPATPPWELARRWFMAGYPLLASVMSTLSVVADADLARDRGIWLAAVSTAAGEVYVNPQAQLSGDEWRFVLAHEALHAALAHADRVGGRDPWLWNVACDFVVNGWLVELAVGTMPDGVLYDPGLAGQSAEAVYELIAAQARRYRRGSTLCGHGVGDLFGTGQGRPVEGVRGVDLDEALRRGLVTGLEVHEQGLRGLVPAGLVAEIRALSHPPIGWDVELARWFDEHFPAAERQRSYQRPSRRQSAVPDIPLAGYRTPEELVTRRTFGVVLDTSGSMNADLLGKALGAIASYAAARDVPAARVVFCDAAAYDAGFVDVADIAGRVRVRGRGGTRLQPGVDLLERAEDFPPDAPILVITDGHCDVLRVRRDHAFLIPAGAVLPFGTRKPVFRVT